MARAPLAERLAALDDTDRAARAAGLQREARAMRGRPAEAAALAHAIIALPDGRTLDAAVDLACFVLDDARMARENDQPAGAAVLDAVEAALAEADAAGRLPIARRVLLAQAFAQAELPVPAATRIDPMAAMAGGRDALGAALGGVRVPAEGTLPDLDRSIDALIAAEADATPLQVHARLGDSLAALPGEVRAVALATIASDPGARRTRLGLYALLDPEPTVRAAVAATFAERAAAGRLDVATLAHLTTIRAWLPDEPARHALDRALAAAMRAGQAAGAIPPPWRVHRVLACPPDGAGAQSTPVVISRGKSKAVAFVLLKTGHGVKDAFIAPAGSASEQRRMLEGFEAEMGAVEVDPAYVPRAIARALGDGAANGTLPAPGLIDIAEIWPTAALRPQPGDTRSILAEIDPEGTLVALSAQARGKLVNESADWPERFAMLDSWFEDNASVGALLAEASSERAARQALWRYLEERRDWWALQCARSAAVWQAAEPAGRDWRAFAAVALALLEGRALKKTPLMTHIVETTLHAEAGRRYDEALDAFDALDDLAEEDDAGLGLDALLAGAGLARPPPKPAAPGEFERRLAGSGIEAAFVDGLATAAAVSPEPSSPIGWLMGIVQAVEHRDRAGMERFLELLTLRAEAAAAATASPEAMTERLRALDAVERAHWATGFVQHVTTTPEAWPRAALGAEDRRLLEALETAARAGMDERLRRALPGWLAARTPR